MKIAVRGGHCPKVTGASALLDELKEDRKVKDSVIKYLRQLGHEVLDVTPPDSTSTSSADLSYGVNKANQWGAELFVSIHFNKAYNSYNGAIGSEVCVYSKHDYAERVVNALASLGFENRGQKIRTGLYELRNAKMKAMIVETCFVEATEDVTLYNKLGHDKIGQTIAEAIANKKATATTPTQVENIIVTTKPVQQTETIFDKAKKYNSTRCTELQTKLNKCGYDCGTVDGIYGVKTHNALGRMQSDNGLNVDYLAGNMTFKKLDELISKKNTVSSSNSWVLRLQKELNKQGYRDKNGNRLSEDGLLGELTLSACPILRRDANGDITGLLQEKLNSLGYSCGSVDKYFGSKTYNAIVLFQKAKGLSQDGIIGEKSWRKLLGL